jgi:hypothetical protein
VGSSLSSMNNTTGVWMQTSKVENKLFPRLGSFAANYAFLLSGICLLYYIVLLLVVSDRLGDLLYLANQPHNRVNATPIL